jgi:hypothetical protein
VKLSTTRAREDAAVDPFEAVLQSPRRRPARLRHVSVHPALLLLLAAPAPVLAQTEGVIAEGVIATESAYINIAHTIRSGQTTCSATCVRCWNGSSGGRWIPHL